jgi:hypothetical protein
MEIVAEWVGRFPEANATGLMFYGLVQLMAAIMVSRFMKPPEKYGGREHTGFS